MSTLILSPRHTPDSQALWRAAIQAGWDVTRVGWAEIESLDVDDPIPYAEPLFNEQVCERFGLELVVPEDDFLVRLPFEFKGRNVRMLTAAEVREIDAEVFLKPPGRKTFAARIYSSGRVLVNVDPGEPVLAQDPVEWATEFRFFILDGVCVTWSNYLRDGVYTGGSYDCGQPEEITPVLALAGEVAKLFALPHAVVLDVGIIRGVGPAVVEANEVCSSGIYGCDPAKVLEILRCGVRKKEAHDVR